MDDLYRESTVLCNFSPLLAAMFVDLEPKQPTGRVGWNLLMIQGMYGAMEVADSEASAKWVSSLYGEACEDRRKKRNIFITYRVVWQS